MPCTCLHLAGPPDHSISEGGGGRRRTHGKSSEDIHVTMLAAYILVVWAQTGAGTAQTCDSMQLDA